MRPFYQTALGLDSRYLSYTACMNNPQVSRVIRRWFAGELDYSKQELGKIVYRLLYHEPNGE